MDEKKVVVLDLLLSGKTLDCGGGGGGQEEQNPSDMWTVIQEFRRALDLPLVSYLHIWIGESKSMLANNWRIKAWMGIHE